MKKQTIIVGVVSAVVTGVGVGLAVRHQLYKGIKYWYNLTRKNEAILKMMAQWVQLEHEDKFIADKILDRGYRSVAIYGMGIAGERLANVLKDSDVTVAYVIDKNAVEKITDNKIVTPEEMLDDVDAVIVTAICSYSEIKEDLEKKVNCPIISLEDIVYE